MSSGPRSSIPGASEPKRVGRWRAELGWLAPEARRLALASSGLDRRKPK